MCFLADFEHFSIYFEVLFGLLAIVHIPKKL